MNIQLVSPSVWGWRPKRINLLKKYVDLTLCLFKFEHQFLQQNAVNSLHLGHPFSKHMALLTFGVMLIVIGIQFFSIGLLGELMARSSQDNENRIKHFHN